MNIFDGRQARQKLATLKKLDFIKEGQNVILTGSPGTRGKRIFFKALEWRHS